MRSAAASAILGGMPEAADLRVLRSDGVTWVFAGKTALFRFAGTDAGMRNIAVAALRQIGFCGTQVAAALGLTTYYVATLRQRAQRDWTAGLVRPRGRPRAVTEEDWQRARQWRGEGVRDAQIAGRLGVQQSTVLRRLGPARVQGELEPDEAAAPGGPAAGREDQPPGPEPEAVPERDGPGPAEGGGVFSRYAGAMLLHAYPGRAGEILPGAAGGEAREAALLPAVSMGFALGAATAGQVEHLVPAEAGPLAGLAVLPSLRTLRPRRWPRSPAPPARWRCRRRSRPRCSRPARRPPGCTTLMTISSRTPGPSPWARDGTTSGAGRRGAARTRT